MANPKFYPALSEIMSIDHIPDSIGFVKDGLISFFDKLYFRDLQFVTSADGGFYCLTIIGIGNLGLEIPGTGFALRLNPAAMGSSSEIPVTLDFRWKILKYVKNFSQGDILQGALQFFELATQSSGLSDEQIIYEAIYSRVANIVTDPESNIEPTIANVQTFVQNVNSYYSLSGGDAIPYPNSTDIQVAISQVVASINTNTALISNSVTPSKIVYDVYIKNTDDDQAKNNIDALFGRITGKSIIDFILDLLTPHITATAELSLGLEFPRSILTPVDVNGEPLATPTLSTVKVGPALFQFSTEEGITLNPNLTGSLNYPSMIGNTGFLVNFTNARIDISDKTNIPEADADGRSVDFNGIFLQQVQVSLPKYWNTSTTISGTNLLIGTEGGLSGTIALTTNSLNASLFGLDISLTTFSVTFHQNSIIASSIVGKLTFNDANGPQEVTITGSFTDDGFSFSASLSDPIDISIGDQMIVTITGLEFNRYNADDSFAMGITGGLKFLSSDIPLVGDFLPNEININKLSVSSKGGLKDFDVNVKWKTSDNTVVLNANNGGLELTVPINKTIGGAFLVNVLRASLLKKDPDGAEMRITIDGALKIGIVDAVVTGFGIKSTVTFDEDNGQIGPIGFSAVGVVYPSGIGVNIDSNGIKGGGFLSFDQDKGLFSGVFSLSIQKKFSVTAVGLLATKLPGGKKGYSLVVIVNATFSPVIQLGYGFTLNGLGGLLGIHRQANSDGIRKNVANGAVGRVLFPNDPVKNAPLVLSDMQTFFPIQQNKYLFGFMAKIAYAGLIKGDLALILEVPAPVRIIMLGSVKAALPSEDKVLLQLRVDFAGIMEFDPFYVSFDASLVDSRILNYTLTGQFAFRLKGGSNPNFLISAGGFHPQYSPPPLSLPKSFARLGINLSSGSSLTLIATSYFAITSNSVQFGAGVYARAASGKASAEGRFGFDALFYFNPFRFTIGAYVSFSIKYRRWTLCSGSVSLSLSGPTPWNASGEVSFRICGFGGSVSFSKTWGNSAPTQALPNVAVMPLLKAAMVDQNNWISDFKVKDDEQISYRQITSGSDIIIGASSTLQISQKVVPFNITISKYGNGKPSDYTKFNVSKVTIGSTTVNTVSYSKDFFAPSLIKEMTATEKVKNASYQKLDSGVQFSQQFGGLDGSPGVYRDIEYENIIIDTVGEKIKSLKAELSGLALGFADDNAAANSALSSQNKFNVANQAVNFKDEEFVLVSRDTLANAAPTQTFTSKLAAQEHMSILISADPALEDTFQVIPKFTSGC